MTIYYRDVSHFDGPVSMAGQPLVIAKATQGGSYTDPTYTGHKADAAAAGVPFGAYHWVDGSDTAVQARHAHDVIGSVPAMWDCEADGATVPRILDLTTRYRALGGVVHLCYLPRWWWQRIGSPDLRPLTDAGLAVVSSNYTTYTDGGAGWAPYGGVTPTSWQYTSTPHDTNAFKGTAAALWALMTGGNDVSELDQQYQAARMEGFVQGRDVSRPYMAAPAETLWPVANGKAILSVVTTNAATLADLKTTLAGLGGGLTDADRALIQALTDAVTALNSRLSTP